MGTSWGQVVKEESKRMPGIQDYTKCQSAVFAYSSLTLLSMTGVSYAIFQLKPFQPIQLKHRLLCSFLLGSASAYYMASVRTKYCQELWMILEGKAPIQKKTSDE